MNSPPREASHVHWVMEVVDTATNQFACAAIIRGMPDELAGYEAGLNPGLCVLFSISNRVYRLSAETEKEARRKARELLQSPGKALSMCGPEFLALPLAKGKEWAGEGERPDHWYRWHVEAQSRKQQQVPGFSAKDAVSTWSLAYRTCPSHEVFDIAEGLGITRYVYEHHGTIQSVDVRLVSVKRPTVQ